MSSDNDDWFASLEQQDQAKPVPRTVPEAWVPRPGDRVQVHNPAPYSVGTVTGEPFEKHGVLRVAVRFDASDYVPVVDCTLAAGACFTYNPLVALLRPYQEVLL